MQFFDLLNEAKKRGGMIYKAGWKCGIRYNEELKMPIYCWAETGQYVEDSSNSLGLKTVIISDKLDGEDWMLLPLPKGKNTFRYDIGEKFLLPGMTRRTIECNNSVVSETTVEKVLGTIYNRIVADDDGCCYYYLRLSDKMGEIVVGEYFLEKLNKVVQQ